MFFSRSTFLFSHVSNFKINTLNIISSKKEIQIYLLGKYNYCVVRFFKLAFKTFSSSCSLGSKYIEFMFPAAVKKLSGKSSSDGIKSSGIVKVFTSIFHISLVAVRLRCVYLKNNNFR